MQVILILLLVQPGQPGRFNRITRSCTPFGSFGVVYLSCEANAGNLYFHKEGEVDLEIMPRLGKLVLLEPWMRHGVRENRSDQIRLSMAFNLFPFPLPAQSF